MKTSSIVAIAAAALMGGNQAEAKLSAGGNTIFNVLTELGGGLLDLIINTTSRRDTIHVGGGSELRTRQNAPPGVPQFEFDRCYESLGGATITLTAPGPGSLAISGVPATCMNLANVLISEPGEGAVALPCGSDCLQYDGLSDAEYNQLLEIANSVA